MPNPTNQLKFQTNQYRESMENNINETNMTLDQIEQYENSKKQYSTNNILPFSLKQHFKPGLKESPTSDNENSKLGHSNLSQKLNRFTSRNTSHQPESDQNQELPHPLTNYHQQKQREHQKTPNPNFCYAKNSFPSKNQQNFQNTANNVHCIDSSSTLNKIQIQVHLTIAKKRYTLKISSHVKNQELNDIIENFLIENGISNPGKKSHLKTKNSIIQMVQQKLQQSKLHSHENPLNSSSYNVSNSKIQKKSVFEEETTKKQVNQMQKHEETDKLSPNIEKSGKNSRKFQRPIVREISRTVQGSESQSSEACSPSFKESEYVSKSPINKTSSFSPEPKHKQNKYEKLVSSYYNDHVIQKVHSIPSQQANNNKQQQIPHHKSIKLTKTMNQNNQQNSQKQLKLQFSQQFQNSIQEQTSTPKSVYEKWKQKEKSKDHLKPLGDPFGNALKDKKIPQNNQPHKNDNNSIKNNKEQFKQKQNNWNSKLNHHFSQNKWINNLNDSISDKNQQKSHSKSIKPDKSQKKIKQKSNKRQNDSFTNAQTCNQNFYNNKFHKPLHHSKTPTKNLNKTQLVHDKSVVSNYSPYHPHLNQFSSDVSPLKPHKSTRKSKHFQNPDNSKVYTVHDEEFPSGHSVFQMSPDHFYKQGLVFEAKKQQQISQKFKSIYPFTTRGQQVEPKSRKNGEVSSQSRQKYFTSKLVSKSQMNVTFDEKQKSALHERLFKEDKEKKLKQVEIEAQKKIFKIAKTPTPQIQINLMQENLKQIKGLSQQKKIKLIEKNIQIKQRIREKDKMIDEELDKMIKEGKVRPACEIITTKKSPFRKTQVF